VDPASQPGLPKPVAVEGHGGRRGPAHPPEAIRSLPKGVGRAPEDDEMPKTKPAVAEPGEQKFPKKLYEKELLRLQEELVKMSE
jgi:hypothetical protein